MDPQGNVYRVDEQTVSNQPEEVTQEDLARMDDFLGRRAERDDARRKKYIAKHGTPVWDSRTQGTYRKDKTMGIEGIENLSGGDSSPESESSFPQEQTSGGDNQQGDPGDEQHGEDNRLTTQAMIDEANTEGDERPGEPAYPGGEPAPSGQPAVAEPAPSGQPAQPSVPPQEEQGSAGTTSAVEEWHKSGGE